MSKVNVSVFEDTTVKLTEITESLSLTRRHDILQANHLGLLCLFPGNKILYPLELPNEKHILHLHNFNETKIKK